jgi:hypothetical protein
MEHVSRIMKPKNIGNDFTNQYTGMFQDTSMHAFDIKKWKA